RMPLAAVVVAARMASFIGPGWCRRFVANQGRRGKRCSAANGTPSSRTGTAGKDHLCTGTEQAMQRRDFLKTATAGSLVAAGGLAMPRLARAADTRVLRFVPQANLANLDPIWTTQYVVRNGSLLIWDMLMGVDDQLQPKPQMVEAFENTSDFKTWTFKLRPGLKFHDGEPVLSKDVVASIKRWMVRDASMGGPTRKGLEARG